MNNPILIPMTVSSDQQTFNMSCETSIDYIRGRLQEKETVPSEQIQDILPDADYDALAKVTVDAIPSDYVGSDVPRQTTLSVSGDTVTASAGYYEDSVSQTVQSGIATVSGNITANPFISVDSSGLITATVSSSEPLTPTVSEGYITQGTPGTVNVNGTETRQLPIRTSSDLSVSGATVTAPSGWYAENASKSVASGTEGTPTAVKGAVSNHSVNVTPSVTNTAGYISGGTHNGTPVTVSASELVSGTKSISANGTGIDVTNYQKVDVAVPASTPSLQTKSVSYTPTTSQQTASVTADVGYDGLDEVNVTVGAMPSGTAGTPTATKGTVSNHSVTITPSVTNTAGYIAGGTITGTGVSVSASELVNGTYSINSSGTKDVTNYASATVPAGTEGTPTATKSAVSNHSVTVTPSVTNTIGWISGTTKTGTAVSVSASELVSGSQNITSNNTYDVTNLAQVVVNVSGGSPTYQTITKTYTPTESQQTETITASSGYDAIEEVDITVDAISSTYVGSGITRRSSTDLTASGATVTAPSGFYSTNATKTISSGSATPPTTISGSQATLSTGTNTITLQKTVSVTPQVTAGYVSSGTAGNVLLSLNANVTTKAAATYHPSTSNQTIASGTYLTGAQTINAVTTSNLTADNIKNGVTIQIGDSSDADCVASVTGTYEGGGGGSVQYDTKTVTASNYPTSLAFTGMLGQPKFFAVRLNANVSSSGSTTYYYIVDMVSNGTTTHGNAFRIGSTRQVTTITSGYSWSYSGTTLTLQSSATSRSASPGAFYSGSYELMYAY